MLDVQEGKSIDSLNGFYSSLNSEELQSIRTVSMDMGAVFISSTKANLAQWKSVICFDKFHVAMDLNKAVNEVRKDEWRIATKDVRDNLHRSRFIFLRSNSTLKETHREKIDSLSCVAKKTARAWAIKQYAMELWHFD